MKNTLLFVLTLSAIFLGCQNDTIQSNTDIPSQINNFPKETISVDELKSLNYMREEEKLAHDVYTTLNSKWNLSILSNISSSEQTHTSAVLTLLNKYNVLDPVKNNPLGIFSDTTLQKLYIELINEGDKSLLDAFKIGATIEDLDIYDLKNWLVKNDNQDIKFVYDNLTKGSRNHMRSFYEQIISRGGKYSAQYITQVELEQIINTPKETGSW